MLKQNKCLKTLLPLSLLLLLTATACDNPEPAANDNASDNAPVTTEEPVTDSPAEPEEAAADLTLALAKDGVLIIDPESGDTQTIAYDTDLVTAQVAVASVFGDPESTAENNECGAGPMSFVTWPNGFTLNAIEDQFVGWGVRPNTESAELTTVDGVGLGKTLADLEANYNVEVFDSTLGIEFNASDGLIGLLSANEPTGEIIALWSGIACTFR